MSQTEGFKYHTVNFSMNGDIRDDAIVGAVSVAQLLKRTGSGIPEVQIDLRPPVLMIRDIRAVMALKIP